MPIARCAATKGLEASAVVLGLNLKYRYIYIYLRITKIVMVHGAP
jgi:hypothetical protein